MKIKPLLDRVLIKKQKAEATKGSIIIPETAQEKRHVGEVVAVGPGKINKDGENIPPSLKIGDKILYSSYAGTEFNPKDQDEEFLILQEDEILAIIE